MPFFYDPNPNPSPRSQAQKSLYEAMDRHADAKAGGIDEDVEATAYVLGLARANFQANKDDD